MLREIGNVRQRPGQPACRWFNDELLDLFVWHDESGRINGFQLCFNKDTTEHALTYSESDGYLLNDVQPEESSLDMGSPVLAHSTALPFPRLLALLAERGAGIDSRVLQYVMEKLEAYLTAQQSAD
jgi:hypothetical protein